MKNVVTEYRRLSQAGRKPTTSPVYIYEVQDEDN